MFKAYFPISNSMLAWTMFQLRVEAQFSAAHFLSSYKGKCENLHGHNYKVRLWVKGRKLDEGGMLIDFSFLKKSLKEVLSALDHTNLNDNEYFQNNPSAERIAVYIYDEITKKIPSLKSEDTAIKAIDVFENKDSMARYTGEA